MSAAQARRPGRLLRLLARLLFALVLFVLGLWCVGAIYYSNLPAQWMRTAASILFAVGAIVLFVRVRPLWLNRVIFLGAAAVVILWFLYTPPSNDRDWLPDVAVLPYADLNGDMVTIHNIRNCDYRSETNFTVQHYDRTVDLRKLQSVDLYIIYWGSPSIAHTMLSFGFEGGDYVCFSIETRKKKGQGYSAIKGLFRQFELTYIVADERDLVRLRTNFRGEQVYLYHLNTDVKFARDVFLDYFKEINRLKEKPEWYNAVTSNCTTSIRGHTYPYGNRPPWDWRILINGYLDELLYERGVFDRSLPFKELKARSLINERAKAAGDGPEFSTRIREGLPGRKPAA